ncbi:MAG: beta-ketoacyl-[acyl-carrier-protein] synthase family protein [Planctomycetia bacterium]|nr:beta-ketoacyl-[acyl-carrier-protein] synthase family protein [Planctomycetia bacterium]
MADPTPAVIRLSDVRPKRYAREDEPIVITGIGMLASVGRDRESLWRSVMQGRSGVKRLAGIIGIPDGLLLGATAEVDLEVPGQLKSVAICQKAAAEALADARVDFERVNLERFACAISAHVGDTRPLTEMSAKRGLLGPTEIPWWQQYLPCTAGASVANRYGLCGPRLAHSVACASGLVDVLQAVRTLRDDQADIALAGSGEAIHPLFAAGFYQMKVLANHEDPTKACRPFNVDRNGFVMGEGGAMFVLERLSHALGRGAKIYAEVVAGRMLAEAHHVTALDDSSEPLSRLLTDALREAGIAPDELSYINCHGTGTIQNDAAEARGIKSAMGTAIGSVAVSATKSMLGHLVNAAGSVELAITALALRDGFTPPTINLTDPDPLCTFDCVPLVGRSRRFDYAMKLSVAFGGHLVCMVLRRWNDPATGFAYPARIAA